MPMKKPKYNFIAKTKPTSPYSLDYIHEKSIVGMNPKLVPNRRVLEKPAVRRRFFKGGPYHDKLVQRSQDLLNHTVTVKD